MNEATAMTYIEGIFKSTLDKNEMYTVEYTGGHDGGETITILGIYDNKISRDEFKIHHTLLVLMDENITKTIVETFITRFRTARGCAK